MKSWTIHEYGAPDVVRLEDVPDPEPGADEVLIRVEAASVNPLDNKLISGDSRGKFPVTFPFALGTDGAGTVLRVGASVTRLKAGDRVAAHKLGGAFSALWCVPADAAALLPDGVTFDVAAALPTAAGTAWEALMEKAQLRKGQTVLVHAGSGGVGHFAVQFAKLAGARVIATTGEENRHLVTDLGADDVVDYKAGDFRKQVSDVDVVLDPLGGETQEKSFDVMRPGGILVSLVQAPDEKLAAARGVRALVMVHQATAERLERIAGLVAEGEVRVLVAERFAFDAVPAALAKVKTGHVDGKVVVTGH